MKQTTAIEECPYMLIQNPRSQRVDRLGELSQRECHAIRSQIVETDEFKSAYEFVRLIRVQYPPTLTLVVKPKRPSSAKPVLIKSGGARDRVFNSVDHAVDYTGGSHRYTFGRFAAESLEGIRDEGWDYRLVLTLESAKP